MASKLEDFKRLNIGVVYFWQFLYLSTLFSILIWATLKGNNMLPIESIFFPLIVAPFKMWLSQS